MVDYTLIGRKFGSIAAMIFVRLSLDLTFGLMFRPLEIDRLLDGFDGLLELKFTVGDIFDDRGANLSISNSVVKVVQAQPQRTEEYLSRRYESIAPDSTARPQKRPLGSNGRSGGSSLREIIRPEDIELEGRSNGYARANKRQRMEGYERNREVDPDRPIISRERDQVEIFSQRSWADRDRSPVQLVEDSQRSPINNTTNREKPQISSDVSWLANLNIRAKSV